MAMDGLKLVRADLCARLDAIEAALARHRASASPRDAHALAMAAEDYGLIPVQRLAEGLSLALGCGGRGAAVGPWIERLRDAIDCESADENAGTNWLASVMVRFAG